MIYSSLRFLFILLIVASAAVVSVSAQDRGEPEEVPKGIKETLVKSRIEREKKDFDEMLERGEETAKLGEEVSKSFVQNKRLTLEDQKKLERIEKLSKKIRDELGASNDSDAADEDAKISSTSDAIDKLKDTSAKLSDELKKTSRYTISAVAIQSSNTVLKIVRFIRQVKD